MKRLAVALALGAMLVGGYGMAQEAAQSAAPAIEDQIVNNPRPDAFAPYGVKPKVIKDAKVQFGKAMRIAVATANPAQPRNVGLNVPLSKPVKKGDKLVLAFWARAEKTEGGAPGKLANVQIQHAADPYTGLFGKPFEVGPEWQMQQVAGVADADYAAGALAASMHFGSAVQVIDLGPVFVLDLGQ
ncbi:hypothetical protein [Sphingomonas japonica]|uniref:Uncharacterized protein n=1 Tax=Sphingomonas japonica TaxID=511662 RepID=A0ABX0U2L3_9SPHN|nr:hypothetical protein [Sphingomonas japonica]NIJ23012.1 hypothetical protein [Sphingomonas japonica]